MVIELKMARGWRIWVNGIQPVGTWDIDDGEQPFELMQDGKPLKVNGVEIDRITFETDPDSWGQSNPSTATVRVDGEDNEAHINVLAWGTDANGPIAVQLFNGEMLEVDEITAYVRMEL